MNNEELIQAIRQWGIDRKIIGNGTFEGQWLKLISEIGELADSLAKGKSPIDDIGDCFVVLVMMEGIRGKVAEGFVHHGIGRNTEFHSNKKLLNGKIQSLLEIASYMFEGYVSYIEKASYYLSQISRMCNLTINECLAHAYNEIKERRGYLNENGVFIKESAE